MKITISSLPATLWRRQTVQNVDDCNYELYLTDFINASLAFMKETNGEKVVHCKTQDKGQWDCYLGEKSFLDFKLLCSQSTQELIAKTSFQLVKKGSIYKVRYPNIRDENLVGFWPHVMFANDSVEDMLEIFKLKNCHQNKLLQNKKELLKTINTNKDCLFLYTDYFWNQEAISLEELIKAAISFFEKWIYNIFKFRDISQKDRKTFLAFMVPQYSCIVICKWDKEKEKIVFYDFVRFEESTNFMKYLRITPYDRFVSLVVQERRLRGKTSL